MANKKITVVGDGAEEPLTPEEEHRIEVKVDAMLDLDAPDAVNSQDSSNTAAAESVTPAPSVSKVTKIVTTFADEPETVEPTVPAAVEAASKPAPKKITIRHHDDEVTESAVEKESAKPIKTAKKPVKKLKVKVADGAEPDDLAAAINESALAAEEFAAAQPESENTDTEPRTLSEEQADSQTDSSEITTNNELAETNDAQDVGAPPLIQKHQAAPIETAAIEDAVDEPVTDSDDKTKESAIEAETEATSEPAAVTDDESVDKQGSEMPTASETVESAEAEDVKKYQPPAGPMQFKRADVPITPLKPGEPRPEPTAEELSEDEALTKAFETPAKPSAKVAKPKSTKHRRRTALVLFVVLLIAAGGGVAAVPSLREKALDKVGLHQKTAVVSPPPTTTTPETTAATSPLSPDIYASKRDGIYNLYKLTTGQPEQLVLAGTGNETDKIALASNASGSFAALISTRDAKRNTAGALQQSFSLVNVVDKKATVIDSADQIKLVDWFGDRIVYVLLNTSTSTNDPNRYQIVSYDIASQSRVILDHMNYLNEVIAAQGTVYYATATGNTGPGQFISVKPDGTAKQVIVSGEIAAVTRISYSDAVLSSVNKWYAYHFGDKTATLTNNVSQKSRLYIDSPDGKRSVYVGNSKLVVVDTTTQKEITLAPAKAAYPVRWLSNDMLVYRDSGADYSVKLSGGQPTKLADVADIAGISLWHE